MVGAPVVDVGSVYLTKQVRPLVVPATLFGIIANSVAEVAGEFAVAAEPAAINIPSSRSISAIIHEKHGIQQAHPRRRQERRHGVQRTVAPEGTRILSPDSPVTG